MSNKTQEIIADTCIGILGAKRPTRPAPTTAWQYPNLRDLPEQQLADLHLAVIRERERRLHEPDRLTISGILTRKTLAGVNDTETSDLGDSHPLPPNRSVSPPAGFLAQPDPEAARDAATQHGATEGQGGGGCASPEGELSVS